MSDEKRFFLRHGRNGHGTLDRRESAFEIAAIPVGDIRVIEPNGGLKIDLPKKGYLRYEDMAEKLAEYDLWTQTEVADYLRVVPATVKNFRERGLLKFFQAPGSSRILYYRDDVIRFLRENTFNDKGGDEAPKKAVVKGRPVVSAGSTKDWRI